LSSQTNQRKHL